MSVKDTVCIFPMQGVVAEILHFVLPFGGFQRYDGMMTCDFELDIRSKAKKNGEVILNLG